MDALMYVARILQARLELDKKYLKSGEYRTMEKELKSLRSKDIATAKWILGEMEEKLSAVERRGLRNIQLLSQDIELEPNVAKREAKLIGAIMVDGKLGKELGL